MLTASLLLAVVPVVLGQDATLVPVGARIMPMSSKQLQTVLSQMRSAPAFSGAGRKDLPTSVNLYPLLHNVPSERNQGSCGDCWAWGSTGVMEIALNVQNGICDRLSMQFINSCNPYKACCDAGGFSDFVSFYRYEGFAIPWTNTNARWTSGNGNCNATPCGSIATTPRYPISSISYYSISTGSDQAGSIANVKNALSQNKGLYFFFYLPNTAAWNDFDNFFFSQSESVVWNNFYCSTPSGAGSGGHVVLCLGYYDDGGANRYWIMLNSWGTTSGRPTGLFNVSMDQDYANCPIGFQTLNVGFSVAPVITNQPASLVVTQSGAATFSIGTAPGTALTYQWKKDGTNVNNGGRITGATSSTLVISNVSSNDAGSYLVTLDYGTSTTNSAPAILTVLVPPYIIPPPTNVPVCAPQCANLTVAAGGSEPLSYRWRRDGFTYPPGTNTFTACMSGNYSVIVSNAAGSLTGSVITVTISYPPQIVTQPQSEVVLQGSPSPLFLTVTGTPPIGFRWCDNLRTYPPGTNSFTTSRAAGYWCIVSNQCGVVTSAVAFVTVVVPPTNQAGNEGSDAVFTAAITGPDPSITCHWQMNGTDLSDDGHVTGCYTPSLGLVHVKTNDAASYTLVMSNSAGSFVNPTATLTVWPAVQPVFTGIARLGDGSIQLSITGMPGASYDLEGSGDWLNWDCLCTLWCTNGLFQYNDPQPSSPRRFYRLKLDP